MTRFKGVIRRASTWNEIYKALVPYNEPGDSRAGFLFEEFTKYYFQTAPECEEFVKVWSDGEVPRKVREQLTLADRDHGADLVLQDKEGRFHVVQCKFKTEQSKKLGWTTDRLSSWLAESDEAQGLILFTNASGLDPHSARKANKKDFRLWTLGDLLGMSPDKVQAVLDLSKGKKPKPRQKFKARDHQTDAIRDVVQDFKSHDRGQMILPCGAGKTLTSLWIKERMKVKKTLVLVPSLALLRQVHSEWCKQQKKYLPYLCVCSEKDIDRRKDAIKTHAFEVGGRVTTDPKEIRKFVRENDEFVIYSTYQSLDVVEQAKVKFELAICDEAHKTAGSRDKAFALIHDGKRIKCDKRLYMTATPRITGFKTKKAIEELKDVESAYELVADMNDEETFGPEFHRMSFAKAIELDILSDYQIVLLGVGHKEFNKYVNKRAYIENTTIDQAACVYALSKVMRKFKAKHAITFHNTIDRAQVFADMHRDNYKRTWIEHVNGAMSTNNRAVLLDEFKNEKKAILTNAKCLTEGVDVPAIDCVMFVDPKSSAVDIVQAAGRALRKLDGKERGYIVVPVFHEDPDEVDEKLKKSVFKPILNVIHALSAHDERLVDEMNKFRFGDGERKPSKGLVEVSEVERFGLVGFENALKRSLFTQILDRIGFREWDVQYQQLKLYVEKYGHCLVSTDYLSLNRWVNKQRSKKDALSASRRERLDALGFVWDVSAHAWNQAYSELMAYKEKHGDCLIPNDHPTLGDWVSNQRQRKTRLTREQVRLLDALGFVWNARRHRWEDNYQKLVEYKEEHGDCLVPQRHELGSG